MIGKFIRYNQISTNTINNVAPENHATRHLPNGTDALTTAAPFTIGTANATGVANSFARSDHIHNFDPSLYNINNFANTLNVAKGGTALSTLIANTFITAATANSMASTKIIPAGTVVGTSDAQTLTNKTLTDATNIVLATSTRRQNILYVNPLGNDATATVGGLPYATLAAAAAIATSGQSIIAEGTHAGPITLASGVNITGGTITGALTLNNNIVQDVFITGVITGTSYVLRNVNMTINSTANITGITATTASSAYNCRVNITTTATGVSSAVSGNINVFGGEFTLITAGTGYAFSNNVLAYGVSATAQLLTNTAQVFASTFNGANINTNFSLANTTLLSSATVARNITFPDATTTVVGTDTTQSLSNKTLLSDNNNNTWAGTGSGNTRTALNNTSYGYLSLGNYNNTGVAANNVAVGYLSLFNTTTAINNVAVGANTALSLTTGNNNVLLGNSADVTNVNDSNAIAIGNGVKTVANTATIGNASLIELRNLGNGVCNLGNANNKFGNAHITTVSLYGAGANAVQLTSTGTTAYTLTLPTTLGSVGQALAIDTSGTRFANTYVNIGFASIAAATNTLTATLTTTMKYLRVHVYVPGSTAANLAQIRFNGDATAAYNYVVGANGATAVATTNATLFALRSGTSNLVVHSVFDIININGQNKRIVGNTTGNSAVGSSQNHYLSAEWGNGAQVTSITLFASTGNFNTGAEIYILGCN